MKQKQFKKYNDEAKEYCKGILKNERNFFRYYLYRILLLISSPLIIANSFIKEGYYKCLHNITKNDKSIRVIDSYKDLSNHKRLLNLILAAMFTFFLKFAIFLIIGFVILILFGISYSIDFIVSNKIVYIIALIPSIIALIVYFIHLMIIYIPVELIIEEKEDISYITASKLAFKRMNLRSSKNVVYSYLIEYLIKILLIGIISIPFILSQKSGYEFLFLIGCILSVIYLLFIPILSLRHEVLRFMIRKDILSYDDMDDIDNFNEAIFNTTVNNIGDLFNNMKTKKDTTKMDSIVVENRTEIEEAKISDIERHIEELKNEDLKINSKEFEESKNIEENDNKGDE